MASHKVGGGQGCPNRNRQHVQSIRTAHMACVTNSFSGPGLEISPIWIHLFVTNELKRLGVCPPFTWRRKWDKLPKRVVLITLRRRIKSENKQFNIMYRTIVRSFHTSVKTSLDVSFTCVTGRRFPI